MLADALTRQNTLLVPHFKYNLLSVKRLVEDAHIKVIFSNHYCLLQDQGSNKISVVGQKKDGLYLLGNDPFQCRCLCCFFANPRGAKMLKNRLVNILVPKMCLFANSSNTTHENLLCHCRLGHILDSKAKNMSLLYGLNGAHRDIC